MPVLDAVQGLFTAVSNEVQVEVELVLGSLLRCMGFSLAVVLSCPSTHGILVPACVLHAKWIQSCPTLCDLMDCGLPGSSVHGILQARILEWVAMPSSKESS